ncbi:hypothetical protein ECZU31_48630 [Escherichia coli]|nr:hypothetical protein ECZU31_48630 [Escherichia coli]
MGATIFCCAEHETLFDLAGQWMKQQIKEKAGNSPARPDVLTHFSTDNLHSPKAIKSDSLL